MTRKIIIYLISIFLMTIAITQIWTVFLPVPASTQPKIIVIDPIQIFMGILFFLAGWNLFRLNDGGRVLAFWLLFIGLAGNLVVLGLVLPPNSNFAISLKLFGKPFLDSGKNYVSTIIFLSVLLVIDLSILVFLSQKETKKIFMSEAIDTAGSM